MVQVARGRPIAIDAMRPCKACIGMQDPAT
eukprot:SAG11_NODE_6815_length_1242_cov_1.487314_1_plen_29_part_10